MSKTLLASDKLIFHFELFVYNYSDEQYNECGANDDGARDKSVLQHSWGDSSEPTSTADGLALVEWLSVAPSHGACVASFGGTQYVTGAAVAEVSLIQHTLVIRGKIPPH